MLTARRPDGSPRQVPRLLRFLPVGLAEVALAALAVSQPLLAVGAVAFTAVSVLALVAPTPVLVASFPATFGYMRVGPGALDMSLSDAVTVMATIAALPSVPWRSRALRRVLYGLGAYLAITAVTVVAHPTSSAIFELPHRMFLFGGPILIGAAVAHRGQIHLVLRAYLAVAAAFALDAVLLTVSTGFQPAFPFGIHKNAGGYLISVGILLLIAAPARFRLPPRVVQASTALLVLGLLACQARGASLALVAAVVLHFLRPRSRSARDRGIQALVLGASALMVVLAFVSFQDQQAEADEFTSLNSRVGNYEAALDVVFASNPLTGGGLRWFMQPGAPGSVPHNLVVSELSESGVVGLAGLALLAGNTLLVLWRRRDDLGEAARLTFVSKLVESLLGIFWVAGSLTLAVLVVGLALDEPPVRRRPPPDDPGEAGADADGPGEHELAAGRPGDHGLAAGGAGEHGLAAGGADRPGDRPRPTAASWAPGPLAEGAGTP